ncbi:MAG: hypothetical protein IKV40_04695 [Clostridia bacterium]|nr:hypothetical protein [Clostridia bacterium]
MKEKLTFDRVCADVAAKCKRHMMVMIGVAVAFALMSLMMLGICVPGESFRAAVMLILFTIYLCLGVLLNYLRMKRAEKGEIYVVRDIVCHREMVRKRRRRRSFFPVYVKTLFLKNNGKYAIPNGGNDAVYDETECGDAIYLVYAGLFPNKIIYAYSGNKYEADFEVKS